MASNRAQQGVITTSAIATELPAVMDERFVLGLLGISRPTLRKLRQQGRIRYVTAGRRVLYPAYAVREFLGTAA